MKEESALAKRMRLAKEKKAKSKPKGNIDKMVKALGGEGERVIKTSIHYPEGLYKKLKMKVARDGGTIRDYVLELIEKDLINEDL